jgi:hypothetical protein
MALLPVAFFADDGSTGPGTAGLTQAITVTVAAGDALYVGVWSDNSAAPTITVADNLNGAHTALGTKVADGNGQDLVTFYKVNCAAGSTTITATFSASTVYKCIAVQIISGGATAAFDVSAGQISRATPGTGTDGLVSAAAVNTKQPAGIFAYGFSTFTGPPAAGTGFTSLATGGTFGIGIGGRAIWKRITATGSQAASFTAGANVEHLVSMAVFDELGATGGADNPPIRRPPQPPREALQFEAVQRRPRAPLPATDEPFLALWGDRGEAVLVDDMPRHPRAPLASGAAAAAGPPLVLRRLSAEAFPDEQRPARRGFIPPPAAAQADAPPIDVRTVAAEFQTEEPIRRLRFTPDAVDPPPFRVRQPSAEQAAEEWRRPRAGVPAPPAVTPGDQPPNRARFRAEEFELERPLQRLEIPWPSGSAPAGDAPPLLARKRPEEAQVVELTQRRGVPPADAPVPDAPPVRAPRPLEAAASEERPRARLVPPVAPAADPPPLRRWIRVEETQADETRPRRFLVYVAPTPADAPPLLARRVPFELALSEPVQRRRVTPPNAPIVPGDLPVFRPGRTPLERSIEERPQRRLMNLAGPSAIVQFNPRFTVKAPAHSRTAKAPASSRKVKAYPRR